MSNQDKPTMKQIFVEWIKLKQEQSENGKVYLRNHMMQEVRQYGITRHQAFHNAANYERLFRKFREKWPNRFKDVSVHFEGRQKTWLLMPKDEEPQQFRPATSGEQAEMFEPKHRRGQDL